VDPDFDDLIRGATTWVLPVLFAITLHEAAHAIAAWWLGDDTAYRDGRVTLNPLKHVDPIGTVLLPVILLVTRAPFLFGWAKPVPVNYSRLGSPRRDAILVIAAGPAANLVLAALSALLFRLVPYIPDLGIQWAAETLYNSIVLNLFLAVFNLLPLPPLDGGNILLNVLPPPMARQLARVVPYGQLILFGLIMLPAILGPRFSVLSPIVALPVAWMMPFFLQIAGL
jgi:Zn-dependent protease